MSRQCFLTLICNGWASHFKFKVQTVPLLEEQWRNYYKCHSNQVPDARSWTNLLDRGRLAQIETDRIVKLSATKWYVVDVSAISICCVLKATFKLNLWLCCEKISNLIYDCVVRSASLTSHTTIARGKWIYCVSLYLRRTEPLKMFKMQSILFVMLLVTAVRALASENCSSERCCWVDMPPGYCGITLPNEPMNIWTRFIVKNLEEVNEAKQSYTITLR